MDTQPDHMSIHEAADYYGVTEKTIRRRLKSGKLPAFKQEDEWGGFEWRVLRVDKGTHQVATGSLPLGSQNGQGGLPTATQADSGEDHGEAPQRHAVLLSALQLAAKLQHGNSQLSGQVGFLEAILQVAEDHIKLRSAPTEPEQPNIWQRLFGKR